MRRDRAARERCNGSYVPHIGIGSGSVGSGFMRRWMATLFVLLAAGCAARHCSSARAYIAAEIERRIAHRLPPERSACDDTHGGPSIPDGVTLEDGLGEDEAVALALWNNSAFLETLADLGIARADLVQAGLLANPVLSVLFPLGPKQLEFTATFPLEALWLRARRVNIANVDAERVANRLVQSGLDLTRDVRTAHAELHRAVNRVRLASDGVHLLEEIANVAEARVRAGEASAVEGHTARLELLR